MSGAGPGRTGPWIGAALCLLAAGCAQPNAGLAPGRVDEGDWVYFHARDYLPYRLDYYYDRSRLRRRGDRLFGRWRVVGSPEPTTTLFVFEIDCARASYSERGTVLIDAGGRRRDLPEAGLLVDQPIAAGTATDRFRTLFCGEG